METCSLEKDRVVLGLDQALANTGYCILDCDHKVVDKGVIKTTSKQDYLTRLVTIQQTVQELVTGYNPIHVFYEDIFTTGKGAWRKLADVKIALELMFYTQGIDNTCMSSLLNRKNSWRKLVGLTSSDKKVWQAQIGEDNEHIADAIGIATGGVKYLEELTINTRST